MTSFLPLIFVIPRSRLLSASFSLSALAVGTIISFNVSSLIRILFKQRASLFPVTVIGIVRIAESKLVSKKFLASLRSFGFDENRSLTLRSFLPS